MLNEFKESHYYAIWFSGLSDDTILIAIAAIESCPNALYIKAQCPKIYEQYAIAAIAKWLIDNQVTENGTVSAAPLSSTGAVSNVKKDVDRDVSREYFEVKIEPCKDCSDSPYGRLKACIDGWLDACKKANSQLGGGSDYGCRSRTKKSCVKDDYR